MVREGVTGIMKKDDAVAILRGVANHLISGEEISYSDKVMLALDVAIDALEKVEKPNEDVPDKNVGDMISRQSAINIVYFECGEWEGLAKTIVKDINDLPSVQPKRTEERTETHACDCISRQAVMDALESIGSLDTEADKKYARSVFEALPSAQPEPSQVARDIATIVENEQDMRVILSHQPEVIRCKDCKHFEYDHPYVIQGVPILGHEVCNAWGDGCKTDENGYCFLAERRTDG